MTSLKRLQKRMDPRGAVNGGIFLGLNGTVVKSHGSADATGISGRDQSWPPSWQIGLSGPAGGHGSRSLRRTGAAKRPTTSQRSEGTSWMRRAIVRGTGHYLPGARIENSWFEDKLDTSDEWIRARTGIERRHFAAEDQRTSDLGIGRPRRAGKCRHRPPIRSMR